MIVKLLAALVILISASCTFKRTSPSSDSMASVGPVIEIVPMAKLPSAFDPDATDRTRRGSFRFPPNTLDMARITRPSAEMRSGPGPSFQVLPNLLTSNDDIIALHQSDSWIFGQVPASGVAGWIVGDAINLRGKNPSELVIPAAVLPKIFAKVAIKEALDAEKRVIHTDIPEGTVFKGCGVSDRHVLAVVVETGGLLWLPKSQIR
jgi:hypothetical protein